MRAVRGLKSLRSESGFSALLPAFSAANRNGFRVVHFSVQTDHVHLIVEADSGDQLRGGLNSMTCRAARALTRVWQISAPGCPAANLAGGHGLASGQRRHRCPRDAGLARPPSLRGRQRLRGAVKRDFARFGGGHRRLGHRA